MVNRCATFSDAEIRGAERAGDPEERTELTHPDLTHEGKAIVHLGGDEFGVPDQARRFTREQIARALCLRAALFVQIDTDSITVTSEIEALLGARAAIERTGSNRDLLVRTE